MPLAILHILSFKMAISLLLCLNLYLTSCYQLFRKKTVKVGLNASEVQQKALPLDRDGRKAHGAI